VFQKIFMVPPCDKIRKVIWDGYIKQAPPLIPEEDTFALSSSSDTLTFEIAKIRKSIDKLNIFTEAELADKRNRITFLRKCLDDRGKHGVLVGEFNTAKENRDKLQAELDEISATLKLVNIVAYRSHRASLIQTQSIFAQKTRLLDETKDIVYPFDKAQLTIYESKVDELTSRMHDYSSKSSVSANTVETLTMELSHISELVGKPKCPTCGHTLDDIESYANSLRERLAKAIEERDTHKSAALKLKEEYLPIQTLIEEYYKLQQQEALLNKQLEPLKALTFDADALAETEQVIEHYAHWEKEFNRVQLLSVSAEGHFRILESEIKQLAQYDKEGKPEDELITLVEEIDRHMNDVRIYQNENVSLRLKEAELAGVVKRIENNRSNRAKNDKRNKYVATLTKAYDILESKNFPRKLVLNYADVVTEHLQENLQLFHIPYQARVVEGFKIEIIDEDDNVVPKASGGQQIQLGLSLHFALHELFSQSFPLMIIDEGTSAQDGKNRAAYFNIIKNLRAKKKLKQIIIIDHDPALAEVVDQLIDLNEIDND
jgi:DNA repair exonuclease SbcCD ATPase subunit